MLYVLVGYRSFDANKAVAIVSSSSREVIEAAKADWESNPDSQWRKDTHAWRTVMIQEVPVLTKIAKLHKYHIVCLHKDENGVAGKVFCAAPNGEERYFQLVGEQQPYNISDYHSVLEKVKFDDGTFAWLDACWIE